MSLEQMSMLGDEPKEVVENASTKDTKKEKLVKVYGNELFTASKDASNEDIRKMIVGEYGYAELTKQVAKFVNIPIEGDNEKEYLLVSPSIPSHKKKG